MSLPRRILAGRTHLVTRRAWQRERWFLPHPEINQLFLYCLFLAADKFAVLVHGCVLAPSHHHLLVTDLRGELPDFCRYFHSLFARSLNGYLGRWEALFAPGSYGDVDCLDDAARIDKLQYIMTHPIKDNWVGRLTLWTGVLTRAKQLDGREIRVRRPSIFFRESGQGALPEEVVGRYARLPGYEHLSPQAYAAHIREQVAQRIAELKARPGGKRFAGQRTLRRTRRGSRPATPAPRRQLNPRLACKDLARRIEAKRELVAFWREHEAARRRWVAGDLTVVFPAGSYWYGRFSPARVAAPQASP